MSVNASRIYKTLTLLLYTGLIFVSIPFVRDVEEMVRGIGLLKGVLGFLLLVYLSSIVYLVFRQIRLVWKNILILFLCILFYLGVLLSFRSFDRSMHFMEYGLLAFLSFRFFREFIRERFSYPLSVVYVALIGWCDEFLQYFFPDRTYDLGDWAVNIFAGVCILSLVSWVSKTRGRETLS